MSSASKSTWQALWSISWIEAECYKFHYDSSSCVCTCNFLLVCLGRCAQHSQPPPLKIPACMSVIAIEYQQHHPEDFSPLDISSSPPFIPSSKITSVLFHLFLPTKPDGLQSRGCSMYMWLSHPGLCVRICMWVWICVHMCAFMCICVPVCVSVHMCLCTKNPEVSGWVWGT